MWLYAFHDQILELLKRVLQLFLYLNTLGIVAFLHLIEVYIVVLFTVVRHVDALDLFDLNAV